MRIGEAGPGADEVEYYSSETDDPHALRPVHMDAHGGWIANPVELLKLLAGIDGFGKGKGLLRPETIALMTSHSAVSMNYAFGFNVNEAGNWWHTGGLTGTSSELGRDASGFCWAILVNNRPAGPRQAEYYRDLDLLYWKVKEAVVAWPEGEPL